MSLTTAFKFAEAFPFCAEDLSTTFPGASFIANVSLSDAMAFAWNLETFSLTATASTTRSGNTFVANATYTLNPISSSVFDEANHGTGFGGGRMWFGDAFGQTSFGSWPLIREPYERVCYDGAVTGYAFNSTARLSSDTNQFLGLVFAIGTDTVNIGMYRIYYTITLNRFSAASPLATVIWQDPAQTPPPGTLINSGTFSIGPLTFSYDCYADGTSSSGGTITSTDGYFTYPP